jgi:hypothetical protein
VRERVESASARFPGVAAERDISATITHDRCMTANEKYQLLVACAWCDRVEIDSAWVEPHEAITALRTFDWDVPPAFTRTICEDCLVSVMSRRAAERLGERAA